MTVQLIVRSVSDTVTCTKKGLVDGKVKVGVGNATGVLENNIAEVVDVEKDMVLDFSAM